jgi:hypothetical protein
VLDLGNTTVQPEMVQQLAALWLLHLMWLAALFIMSLSLVGAV